MNRFFHGWKRAVCVGLFILAIGLIGGFMTYQQLEETVVFRALVPLNLLSMVILFMK